MKRTQALQTISFPITVDRKDAIESIMRKHFGNIEDKAVLAALCDAFENGGKEAIFEIANSGRYAPA